MGLVHRGCSVALTVLSSRPAENELCDGWIGDVGRVGRKPGEKISAPESWESWNLRVTGQ